MSGQTVFWDVDTQVDFMSPEGSRHVPGAEAWRGRGVRVAATDEVLAEVGSGRSPT